MTLTAVILCAVLRFGLTTAQGPLEAEMAVDALQGSSEAYMRSRAAAAADLPGIVMYATVGVLCVLWGSYGLKALRFAYARSVSTDDRAMY